MGERPETVHLVGCPRIDLVAELLQEADGDLSRRLFAEGVGEPLDLDQPFVIVSQHSVTSEYGQGEEQISQTLAAVRELELQAIVLWPNADAGSEDVARGIRKFRERGLDDGMHFFKNLPTDDYIRLLARTAVLVGNSSSAIREGAFIGTPAVNIGTRQTGRQRGPNVIDVPNDAAGIRGCGRAPARARPLRLGADLRRRQRGAPHRRHPLDGRGDGPEAHHLLMTVLGLIPARGGSKGIPGKNLAFVAGRPLLAWTCAAATESARPRPRRLLHRL